MSEGIAIQVGSVYRENSTGKEIQIIRCYLRDISDEDEVETNFVKFFTARDDIEYFEDGKANVWSKDDRFALTEIVSHLQDGIEPGDFIIEVGKAYQHSDDHAYVDIVEEWLVEGDEWSLPTILLKGSNGHVYYRDGKRVSPSTEGPWDLREEVQ